MKSMCVTEVILSVFLAIALAEHDGEKSIDNYFQTLTANHGEIQQAGQCFCLNAHCWYQQWSVTVHSHHECCCHSGGLSFSGPAGCVPCKSSDCITSLPQGEGICYSNALDCHGSNEKMRSFNKCCCIYDWGSFKVSDTCFTCHDYLCKTLEKEGKCYASYDNCFGGTSFTAETHKKCCCENGGKSFDGPEGCFKCEESDCIEFPRGRGNCYYHTRDCSGGLNDSGTHYDECCCDFKGSSFEGQDIHGKNVCYVCHSFNC